MDKGEDENEGKGTGKDEKENNRILRFAGLVLDHVQRLVKEKKVEIGMPPSIVRKVKECWGMIPQEWADFISLHLSQKPEDAEKVANYLYRALKRLPAGSDGLLLRLAHSLGSSSADCSSIDITELQANVEKALRQCVVSLPPVSGIHNGDVAFSVDGLSVSGLTFDRASFLKKRIVEVDEGRITIDACSICAKTSRFHWSYRSMSMNHICGTGTSHVDLVGIGLHAVLRCIHSK